MPHPAGGINLGSDNRRWIKLPHASQLETHEKGVSGRSGAWQKLQCTEPKERTIADR